MLHAKALDDRVEPGRAHKHQLQEHDPQALERELVDARAIEAEYEEEPHGAAEEADVADESKFALEEEAVGNLAYIEKYTMFAQLTY